MREINVGYIIEIKISFLLPLDKYAPKMLNLPKTLMLRIAPIFIINCPDFAHISSTFQLPRFPFCFTKDSDFCLFGEGLLCDIFKITSILPWAAQGKKSTFRKLLIVMLIFSCQFVESIK